MGMNPRLLRPTASGFDPRRIAGLSAWYDAQVASSITIETGVSQWNDLSGLGRHMIQAVGNNQPARVTDAGLGGKFVIQFDGSNDSLRASFTQSKPVSILCVAKFATTPLNDTIYDGTTLNTVRMFSSSNAVLSMFSGAQLNSSTVSPGLSNAYFVSEAIFDSGASSRHSVNGSFTATGNAGSAAMGGMTMGNSGNLLSASDVNIAELLMYSGSLSLSELGRVRKYLGNKYGITVA